VRVPSLLLSIVICVLLAWAAVSALGFNQEARRMPLVIAVPTAVLAGAQVVRDSRGLLRGERQETRAKGGVNENLDYDAEDEAAGEEVDAPSEPGDGAVAARSREQKIRAPMAFAWVFGLIVTFLLLGLLVTVPIFVGAFTWLYGRERLRTIILMAGGTFAVTYLFFVRLLEMRLYSGALWDWFS
jgi:hypothetical protein